MQHSYDIGWLDVGMQENGRLAVRDHDRLSQAVAELPHQDSQYPSLCAFIGGSSRESSLQQMFPLNNIRRHTSAAHIKLRYDIGSMNTPQPILFADGDIPKATHLPVNLQAGTGYPTVWDCPSAEKMLLVLWARLMFLFADVVCIFIDTPSDLDIAVNFIARCEQLKSPAPWIATCPRLIIAFGCGIMQGEEFLGLGTLWEKLQSTGITNLNTIFSDVQSIDVIGDLLSSTARHDRVKRLMMDQLDGISTIRRRYLGRASGKHLAALFQAGLRHTVMDVDSPFNHFMAIRKALPMSPTAGFQLRHFLEMGSQAGLDMNEMAPSIASAVLMDHYVPGMISNLPPFNNKGKPGINFNKLLVSNARLIFQALYRSDVLQGCRADSLRSDLSPEQSTNLVESKLMTMFECLSQTDCSSASIRENQLKSQSGRLARIQSTRICLYCIFRSAQHVLACGHTLCDRCAQVFGMPGEWDYQFVIKGCLYCLYQRPLVVDVLPPTMTPSILAIDGGGVRGVIPLEFLLLVEEQLAPCTVYDVIDLAVGTSSGGLIALGIFIMRWAMRDCSETFERLARQIFREKRHSRWPWASQGDGSVLGEITRWIHWLLHDSCYDAQVFDTALRTAFGDQRLIFGNSRDDPQGPLRSGPKVGVITTSISRDTSAFVIGNFNAAHDSESNSVCRSDIAQSIR
ncbi:patatin-like phospholipase [Penicillium longicatenatum]|uniref:patatin-like phospholipase n=1 Tax=Penicillium longicatenatum TaxID=1561947 RepID=UPI002546744C|nr:patatin-like phospholipase [Penicillium longicatenatum]KAJ5639161.1 patatin-like phospholipase [Penicillium longicatenatum]